ncbi:hypothetical protein H4S14_002455 [Agrobacterium vitis]|nr:hypothetical protein [Agrobacterium vitis]MBE1438699.1 hypothetical protein [Agrobacterium vitis]
MWEMVGSQQPDGIFVAQAAGPALEDGEFWSHALERIKDDPDGRYAMARRHLPLCSRMRTAISSCPHNPVTVGNAKFLQRKI